MTLAIQVTGLTKRYGGVTALNAVQLSVPASSIAGIIGPNGAGKSTFFDLVNGIIEPSSGGVTVMGHPLAGLAPHQVAALGVARTFQRTAVFAESSVIENLAFGRHMHMRHGVVATVLRTRRAGAALTVRQGLGGGAAAVARRRRRGGGGAVPG